MDPVAIVEVLNEIGARNAIGRIDLVENRFVGMKSRGCYETPGGTLLLTAHRELEALCLDRDLIALQAAHRAEVCRGRVLRSVVHAVARIAAGVRRRARRTDVSGTVTLALYKGNIDVAGRKSETSLYRPDIASFTMGASYNQKDAEGFIRILGLPARSRALVKSRCRSWRRKRRMKSGSSEVAK